jgi:hypothetical protein
VLAMVALGVLGVGILGVQLRVQVPVSVVLVVVSYTVVGWALAW